jgi:ATP-binding cassette subfamily B protein
MSLTLALAGLASAVFAVGGLLVALFVLQPLLVPLVLIGYVPLWRATTRTGQRMYSFSFGATPGDRARQYLETVLTRRDPAKEVRAFSLAPMLTDRWRRLYDERIEEIRQRAREHVRRSAFASVGSAALNAVTLGVIVLLLLSERMSVAGAATAAIAIQLVGSRLQSATTGTSGLYENALYLEDFITFLRTPVEERAGGRPAPRGFDRLVVSNVSFSYPGADVPALRGVDLEIGAGEIVALVGENGSGKTTLAKLLCQLYRPERGRILWDGVDTATLDSRELRRSVAVIFQDFLKYQLPARDNIAAGLPERVHDLDAIREAARRSGAGLFLEAVGYDTILSKEFEGGTDLSVGQWQRVALARAFFRDAPFIVLDEPTAALDPRAEYELFQSIRELCAGRSVLLISHRFSSVRSADRIYVLESGRVTEHGSHAELMTRNGLYAELFTLQASAYLGDPAAEFQA